jgi:hypothetical protein
VVELANHNRKLQFSNPATGNGRGKMAKNDLAYFGPPKKFFIKLAKEFEK